MAIEEAKRAEHVEPAPPTPDEAAKEAEMREAIAAVKAAMQGAYEEPSGALRQFYRDETPAVVATCEEARKAHKRSFAALQMAHDAFAGKGREGRFKLWCQLAGINYDSARASLSRRNRQQRERAAGASANKVSTSGSGNKDKPPKTHDLVFRFTEQGEQEQAWACVERVMQAREVDREAALLYICDVFDGRAPAQHGEAA